MSLFKEIWSDILVEPSFYGVIYGGCLAIIAIAVYLVLKT